MGLVTTLIGGISRSGRPSLPLAYTRSKPEMLLEKLLAVLDLK